MKAKELLDLVEKELLPKLSKKISPHPEEWNQDCDLISEFAKKYDCYFIDYAGDLEKDGKVYIWFSLEREGKNGEFAWYLLGDSYIVVRQRFTEEFIRAGNINE